MTSTSEAILQSAVKLFAALSYEKVSIRMIANDCDVTHSLVHRHWESKEALFRDAIAVSFRDLKKDIFPYGMGNELDLPILVAKILQRRDAEFFRIMYTVGYSPEATSVCMGMGVGEKFRTELEEVLNRLEYPIPELNPDTFIMGLILVLQVDRLSCLCEALGWDSRRRFSAIDKITSSFLRLTYTLKEAPHDPRDNS